MKIVFMGTPDFAAEVLEGLLNTRHEIVGVVSQPDRPRGRGHKLMPTDVKVKAEAANIPVYQPETLKGGAFDDTIAALDPDLIVVAAYGKIIPKFIIDYPKYGCVNVHASLLPKYRGAAPIQRAIIDGETETGVTLMRMDYGLDEGDIIVSARTPIGQYETSARLFDRLAKLGSELLVKTIDDIALGNVVYTKQDDTNSSYAAKITKDDAKIDWYADNTEISKLICGMNSYPLAQTTYKGQPLKIAHATLAEAHGRPGEVIGLVKGEGLLVACGKGGLYLKTVQFAGSKKMDIEDYARGHRIEHGIILGETIL